MDAKNFLNRKGVALNKDWDSVLELTNLLINNKKTVMPHKIIDQSWLRDLATDTFSQDVYTENELEEIFSHDAVEKALSFGDFLEKRAISLNKSTSVLTQITGLTKEELFALYEGEVYPWKYPFQKITLLISQLQLSKKIFSNLIRKIQVRPQNSSIGVVMARSDKELSAKRRQKELEIAMKQVEIAREKEEMEQFIQKLLHS